MVRYYHAAAGFPTKPTWIRAIKNNHYASWPGLTADVVARHYPDSEETPKGHGRKAPSSQLSTKMTTLALDDSDNVFGIDNIEAPRPSKKERTVFYRVLDVNEEAAQKIYTDQPGRFPKKSSRGNQYIMVLTEVDSDAILVEPMKNRTAGEMIRAYQVLIDRLNSAGIFPKLHILDNECSTELKTVIKTNKMTFQLVPPTTIGATLPRRQYKPSRTTLSPSSVVQIKCFLCTFGIDSYVKPSIPSTCYDLHA